MDVRLVETEAAQSDLLLEHQFGSRQKEVECTAMTICAPQRASRKHGEQRRMAKDFKWVRQLGVRCGCSSCVLAWEGRIIVLCGGY